MPRVSSVTLPLELRPLLAGLASAQVQDDQQWILALLRKRSATVTQMLWRMLGSEQDVLDAYQTTVCKLIARGKGSIGSWPPSTGCWP